MDCQPTSPPAGLWEPIPTVSITEVQEYLGVPLSPMRMRVDVAGKLEEGLRNLSSVPLKSQQCLYMLKTNLLPAINHQLVLATASKKYLLWLDRMVRIAVRTWLKYPPDTPKAYFHANIGDGGLGIVSLELQIPLLKIKRINQLWASDDPVIREMLKMESAESLLARQRVPSHLRGVVLNSPESLQAALAEELHSPVDGRGLEHSNLVPTQDQWVARATGLLSGANYIGALKICGHLLHSAARAARGRPYMSVSCDACRWPKTLGHALLQTR